MLETIEPLNSEIQMSYHIGNRIELSRIRHKFGDYKIPIQTHPWNRTARGYNIYKNAFNEAFEMSIHRNIFKQSKDKIEEYKQFFNKAFANNELFWYNDRRRCSVIVCEPWIDAFNGQLVHSLIRAKDESKLNPKLFESDSEEVIKSPMDFIPYTNCYGITHRSITNRGPYALVAISTTTLYDSHQLEDTIYHELCHVLIWFEDPDDDKDYLFGGHTRKFAIKCHEVVETIVSTQQRYFWMTNVGPHFDENSIKRVENKDSESTDLIDPNNSSDEQSDIVINDDNLDIHYNSNRPHSCLERINEFYDIAEKIVMKIK